MTRDRTSRSKTTAGSPLDSQRRAFLTFTAPAVGVAGLAAGLLRVETAAGAETARPQLQDDDGGTQTAHRQAYYRRARF